MFVIETLDHLQVGRTLRTLRSVKRPDGGMTSNAKVDEVLYDADTVYTIREAFAVRVGTGTYSKGVSKPKWNASTSRWEITTTLSAPPPPAPDPVPGDDDYNHAHLRARDYPSVGDQLDALWKELIPAPGSEAETVKAYIEKVKAKHPKP